MSLSEIRRGVICPPHVGRIHFGGPPGRRGTLRTGAPRWGSNRSVSPLPVSEKTTAGRANLPPGRDERKKGFPVSVLLPSMFFISSIRFFLRLSLL